MQTILPCRACAWISRRASLWPPEPELVQGWHTRFARLGWCSSLLLAWVDLRSKGFSSERAEGGKKSRLMSRLKWPVPRRIQASRNLQWRSRPSDLLVFLTLRKLQHTNKAAPEDPRIAAAVRARRRGGRKKLEFYIRRCTMDQRSYLNPSKIRDHGMGRRIEGMSPIYINRCYSPSQGS